MSNNNALSEAQHQKFFTKLQDTKEAAIALYKYSLFSTAAIFKTPRGKFVLGNLKPQYYSETYVQKVAIEMRHLLQYEMIAYCPPLIEVWKDFDLMAVIDDELIEAGYNPQEMGERFDKVAQDALKAVNDER